MKKQSILKNSLGLHGFARDFFCFAPASFEPPRENRSEGAIEKKNVENGV